MTKREVIALFRKYPELDNFLLNMKKLPRWATPGKICSLIYFDIPGDKHRHMVFVHLVKK